MDPLDFLQTATALLQSNREADWRTSASRSYCALFHVFRDLFQTRLGSLLARAKQRKPRHEWIVRILRACDDRGVVALGDMLKDLLLTRRDADYELSVPVTRERAAETLEDARDLLSEIDTVGREKIAREASASIHRYG